MLDRAQLMTSFRPRESSRAARLFFRAPDGEIQGTGAISLKPDARASVLVEVDNYSIPPEYHGLLMHFLEGAAPEATDGHTTFRIGLTQKEKTCQVEARRPEPEQVVTEAKIEHAEETPEQAEHFHQLQEDEIDRIYGSADEDLPPGTIHACESGKPRSIQRHVARLRYANRGRSNSRET